MSWLTKMKKSKNTKTISSEEALKDVEPYFSDKELEEIRKDDDVMKFKIGDMVKNINTEGYAIGEIGKVICINEKENIYGIEFNKHLPGCHDLDGKCKSGCGYYLHENKLELIEPIKVENNLKCDKCGTTQNVDLIKYPTYVSDKFDETIIKYDYADLCENCRKHVLQVDIKFEPYK